MWTAALQKLKIELLRKNVNQLPTSVLPNFEKVIWKSKLLQFNFSTNPQSSYLPKYPLISRNRPHYFGGVEDESLGWKYVAITSQLCEGLRSISHGTSGCSSQRLLIAIDIFRSNSGNSPFKSIFRFQCFLLLPLLPREYIEVELRCCHCLERRKSSRASTALPSSSSLHLPIASELERPVGVIDSPHFPAFYNVIINPEMYLTQVFFDYTGSEQKICPEWRFDCRTQISMKIMTPLSAAIPQNGRKFLWEFLKFSIK